MKKIKPVALSQIIILVIGIVSIGYALGSSIEEVSAYSTTPAPTASSGGAKLYGYGGGTKEFAYIGNKWHISTVDGFDPVTNTNIIKGLDKANPNVIKKAASSNFGVKTVFNNFLVAASIYGAIQLLGPLLFDSESGIDAASVGVGVGYFVGKTVMDIFKGSKSGIGKFLGTGWGGFAVGGVVAIGFFLALYKKTDEKRIDYTCYAWDAPTGGHDCEECNKGLLPCTEYQCKSLGQACELINQGTGEEECIWQNKGDTKPPVIQPREDSLIDADYSYRPDSAINPPDRGVFVKYKGDCIGAFTPFNFGVTLDEPGKCKIDSIRKENFEEMAYFFGGSPTLKYNHTQAMSLPGPEALAAQNLTLENDGNYELFIRCEDANGNSNVANFVFKYCVDKGPDTTPPLIVTTNILNNTPIGFNQSEVDIELYVNEPVDCRWNYERDTSFENMENNMQCSSSVFEMNAQMLYKCTTTLNGLQNRQENKFYFRCKDKPIGVAENDRNVNAEGYSFVLIGTQPLVIDSIGPEGLIKDSVDTVNIVLEAETSAGYKEGDATCYYSRSCWEEGGSKEEYNAFFYEEGTSSYSHKQDIWVSPGEYECSIKCVDLGGNADTKEFQYRVEVDTTIPKVVRAYHEDDYLKIITDEKAECVYSPTDCNYLFEPDGIPMNALEDTEHYADWDAKKTYYIKCQDNYGNQPFPNSCSIIIRPVEDYQ